MKSVVIISGWAHGLHAIEPMGNALSDQFKVHLITGAQVLRERHIPAADYILTGSMGGVLAMEMLPKSCQKLVLISSTAKFCRSAGYDCGTPEKMVRRMITKLQGNSAAVLADFFKQVHLPQRQSRSGRLTQCNPLDELTAGLEYLLTTDLRAHIPTLNLPILLLHGTADQIIPSAASEWLHAHLPASRLGLFKNHGHALPAHHFGGVMDAVKNFLSE